MTVLVLSGNRQETTDFIAQEGLPSSVRHIANKGTVPTGVPVSRIYVLPSYRSRHDYHAVEANVKRVIRRCHDVEVLSYEQTGPSSWRLEDSDEPVVEPVVEPIVEPVVETSVQDDFMALFDENN